MAPRAAPRRDPAQPAAAEAPIASAPPTQAGQEGDVYVTRDGVRWVYHAGVLGSGIGAGWVQEGSPVTPPSTTVGPTTPGGTPTGGLDNQPAATTNAPSVPATTQTAPPSTDDWLTFAAGQFQQLQNQVNDPNTWYNQALANPDTVDPSVLTAAKAARGQDVQQIATLGKQVSDEYDRRKQAAKQDPNALTPKEEAEIDVRIAQARAATATSEIELQRSKLALQQEQDPTNQALARQAADLDNQKRQWDTYSAQVKAQSDALALQYGPEDWAANLDKLKLGNQAQAQQNQFYPAVTTAGINQTQAQTAASLAAAGVDVEKLRRAQEGDYLAKAEDLDRAVVAGKITRDQAVQLLDDYMQGTDPWHRQVQRETQAANMATTAMQQGELMSPAQARAGTDFYNRLNAQYGGPDVPMVTAGGGMTVPNFLGSIGVDMTDRYARASGANPPQAASSLNLGTDWRGMDPGAVIRAVKSYATGGGQSGAPQLPAPPTMPTLLAVPQPGAAPAAPAATAVKAAGSLSAPPTATPTAKPAGGTKKNATTATSGYSGPGPRPRGN